METKLAAGQTINTLTKDEFKDAMDTVTRDWFNQVSRGDRYRRFSGEGTVAAGLLEIGGPSALDANLGPKDGFVWAVQRIAVKGLTTYAGDPSAASTEPVALFLNDTGPSSLVHPQITGYQAFGSYELILYPGDTLLVTGQSLTHTGIITLTGMAREVPLPLAWRLGG